MKFSSIFLFNFLCAVWGHRNHLEKGRKPHWYDETNRNFGPTHGQPEQIHLSYGGSPDKLIVTWVTFDDTIDSIVEYGIESLNSTIFGNLSLFTDEGPEEIDRYIHSATIENIQPGKLYWYRVGSVYGWSPKFSFTGLKERPEGGYRYVVYGDMGHENPRALGNIQKLSQQNDFDMVLHVGDFAYNMDTDDGTVGDKFMRQIEPIAAYVPYMTVVGNHEHAYNFSHYVNRFRMPDSDHNLFYSFDLGQAHIIAFSTEFYHFTEYGTEQIKHQYNWLTQDLEKANKNRNKVPWVITLGHRPMYCSVNEDTEDCIDAESIIYNGTDSPYVDPVAPVHIITGSAGCFEQNDSFIDDPSPWSAFRSPDYGFSRMQIFNSTHLYFEQISAANDMKIDDSFWLIKHRHQPYGLTLRQTSSERIFENLDKLRKFGTYIPYSL